MLDISSLDTSARAEEGADLVVRHPTEGYPLKDADGRLLTIRVVGRDSERSRRAEQAVQDRRVRMNKGRGFLSSAEMDDDLIEVLAACTLGWEPFTLHGEVYEYSRENARKLYERVIFIREQVEAFRSDRANFLPSSQTSL